MDELERLIAPPQILASLLAVNDLDHRGRQAAVERYLDALAIPYTRHEHPPVATVAEAERYWAGIDALHTRNLFLRNRRGRGTSSSCSPSPGARTSPPSAGISASGNSDSGHPSGS